MAKNKKKKKEVEKQYGNGIAPISLNNNFNLNTQTNKSTKKETKKTTKKKETTKKEANNDNVRYYTKYNGIGTDLYKEELVSTKKDKDKESYTYKNTKITGSEKKKILNDKSIKVEDRTPIKKESTKVSELVKSVDPDSQIAKKYNTDEYNAYYNSLSKREKAKENEKVAKEISKQKNADLNKNRTKANKEIAPVMAGSLNEQFEKQQQQLFNPTLESRSLENYAPNSETNPFSTNYNKTKKEKAASETMKKYEIEEKENQVILADYLKNYYEQENQNPNIAEKILAPVTQAGTLVTGIAKPFGYQRYEREDGLKTYLPDKLDLNFQKTGEKIDNEIGKFVYDAGGEASKILASSGVNLVAPGVGTGLYWTSMGGNNIAQARNKATEKGEKGTGKVLLNAAAKTALEYVTGKFLGSATKGLTGGKASELEKAIVDKVYDSKFLESLSDGTKLKIARLVGTGVSEGTEEAVQDPIEKLIDILTFGDDGKHKNVKELVTDLETYLDALKAGAAGALTSWMVEGANMATNPSYYEQGAAEIEKNKRTKNEQKIIDAELKNRIVTEFNGEATAKEIAQLQKEIIEDMEKGYVSTDTIEQTLGGKTYKELEKINQKKNNIQQEINELQKKADNNELSSLEEKQKLNDLKEEIKTIDDTEIKNRLNQEIQETIKNDISLQESYKETGRRKENYSVDLSKVEDEKQRAVYQKAMDSGVLNNSNKTHALVDMIAKISSDKNIDFDFTNNERLEQSGFGLQGDVFEVRDSKGKLVQEFRTEAEAKKYINKLKNPDSYKIDNVYKAVNGYLTKNGIAINLNSSKAINRIVGHEITHTFEGTKLHEDLKNSLKKFAGETRWNELVEEYKYKYQDVEDSDPENELISDLVGDYLFTDENYVRDLSTKHKTTFDKVYDQIKYLYNVATAGSKEQRQLAKVKKTFDKMYNELKSKTTSDAKLSLGKHYGDLGKARDTNYFAMNSSRRSTGHFGNGTYFVGENYQVGENSTFAKRPETKVEFDDYKLYKPNTTNQGFTLHDGLKALNYGEYDSTNFKLMKDDLIRNGITEEQINNAIDKVEEERSRLEKADYKTQLDADSLSTIFMKELGYNGIDVRGLDNLDNTTYGSVIYDLDKKNTEIKENKTITENSEDEPLTPGQIEKFKNSKAVTKDGRLWLVHHGTPADFTIFDINKAGKTGLMFGNGFYFTNSESRANAFTEHNENGLKSGYINIEKPASRTEKTMTYNEFKDLYKALNENPNMYDEEMGMSEIDALLSDYGDIYNDKENTIKNFYDSYNDDVSLIDNLSYMYNQAEMYKTLRDVTGYDGIIVDNPSGYDSYEKFFIAFNPDQFKLATNENPTSNPDIRYSISRETGKLQENGKDVTLETTPIGNGTLMAMHNISEEKFNGVLDLGGIPVPSIAITNPNIVDHNQFGEGTLIFNKSTIDPAVEENEVYDRDVWSPTFPNIEYEVFDNKIDDVAEKLGMESWELRDDTKRVNNPDALIKMLSERETIKQKIENGLNLEKEISELYGKKGIENDKELFTPSGNRRSFWQLHEKYNLDNIVKALTKGDTKGTQKFFPGYGQIQSKMANKFNSIEDIKNNESLIQNLGEKNQTLLNAREQIESDIDKIVENNDTDYFVVSELLADFADGDLTVENFKNLTKNYYQTSQNVSDSLINKIIDDLNNLKNLPTNYFEAKPQRAVGLDEIEMAVIPNTWSNETKQRLTDNGISYTEYDPSIEGDRNKVVNQFDNLKFSLSRESITKDSQGRELSEGQQEYFRDSKVRDENGYLLEVYHGTPNGGFTIFDRNKTSRAEIKSQFGTGFYFTNDSRAASDYNFDEDIYGNYTSNPNAKTYKVYLDIENPLVIDERNANEHNLDRAKIKELLLKGDNDYFFDEYIPFITNTPDALNYKVDGLNKEQIKSLSKEEKVDYWLRGTYDLQNFGDKSFLQSMHRAYKNNSDLLDNFKDIFGYDGIIVNSYNGRKNQYIAFDSNQIKNIDNLNPTENEDIRYSLDRAPISKNFLTEAEQDELDGLRNIENSGWAELTPKEQSRMYELENRANTILNKKAEKMLRSASYKAINTTTKIAQNYLDFDANQKKEFRSQMREFSNMTKDELVNADTYNKVKDIVSQYANKEYTYFDDSVESLKRELKHTKIQVSDELKNQITDYGDFVKDSKLMLRRNSGQSVDKVYKEYSDMYPGFFDEDLWNEADQLEALNDFVNHDFSVTEKYRFSDNDLKTATDLIYNKLLDNSLTQQDLIETEEILDKKAQKRTRAIVDTELLNKMGITADTIQAGNDIAAIAFARTDPIRVNEKVFGWKTGQLINDATVNFTKHQEAERIRFLNKERQEIKDLGIKARSKESELVQKYGEKQYVDKNNEVHEYGDAELERDVQDYATREKIKNAARVLRQKYDTYLDMLNEAITAMGYDEIPKRKDYMRHFVELDDVFSRLGTPFNKEAMSAEDLPTDINGLTEFNKPGRSYFANAKARTGLQTTYDAITGIDGYLEGMSNWIYHTESIQRYRALSRFIRENYGREHGLDNMDLMTDEELAERVKNIQDNKLSKYVAWLDEQANAIAGKKATIDRSLEKTFGRKVYTALNTLKSQVGSNMTGFNVRSAMTNFASAIQGMSKTQKLAFAKGTISTINNIIHNDGMIEKSDFLTRRLLQSDSLAMKPWQKLSKAGQVFMEGTDYFTANQIWRGKYYENLQKGMSEEQAIKKADDFAARIMGDRSKGSTAELFNSKTWGFLTQFQLEVNNQWSSLIHDNKIDIQKGNKTPLGVTFELGQLFAASYMFNTMMKSLTGSDVMIDPIDMLLKIFKPDDDDKDKGIVERAQEVLGEFINQLPFASMFTGGRIPIGEAFKGGTTLVKKLSGGTDNYGNKIDWADVDEDLKDSLAYWVLPTGWGQIKKTTKGLSMYDDKLPIAGSYTKSGNLRFSAEDTALGKVKAGLFGQYSSKYAQDYINSGYKSINASKLDEMKDLDMNSTEYREYRQGLSDAGTSIQDKLDYISSLDVSDEDKTIMASNAAKKDIDMSEYKKYGTYEEFNYAQKNPAKYQVMKYIGGYDTYKNYEKAINDITADYDRNGKAITNSRKNKVIKYVNSLNLTRAQKAMLIKQEYPSFTKYDSEIASYINKQNISFIEKAGILKQLGFKAYDKQIINYIRQNYRTVEEQQEELEKLGFKVYNYNGKTYVR